MTGQNLKGLQSIATYIAMVLADFKSVPTAIFIYLFYLLSFYTTDTNIIADYNN